MNRISRLARGRALLVAALLALAAPAFAGPGHDHDHDHDSAATPGMTLPRFEAQSDLFELVGVLRAQSITLYLDRYSNNEPVMQARIEYELNGRTGVAAPDDQGSYVLPLGEIRAPADLALSFTITAGDETDLLAANLSLPDPQAGQAGVHGRWARTGVYVLAGGLLLAAIAGVAVMRRRRAGGV
jgi:hypothetical protein